MTTFTPGLDGSKYRLRGYPDSEVRIYATDGAGFLPLHGAYRMGRNDFWVAHAWTSSGEHRIQQTVHDMDLIDREPVVVKVERWSFAWDDGDTAVAVHRSLIEVETHRNEMMSAGFSVSAIQHHVYEVKS
jgi:hypothetical protein